MILSAEDAKDDAFECLTRPCVYFMGPERGQVKIGYATNLHERERHIRNSSPVHVWVHAEIEGDRVLEREYHTRFKQWRLHGEWFQLVPEIQAEIERINAEWDRRIMAARKG